MPRRLMTGLWVRLGLMYNVLGDGSGRRDHRMTSRGPGGDARLWAGACALAILLLSIVVINTSVFADDYPSRPVHIIIGFSAGAAADTPARLLAQKFSQRFGQQFIVENRPGAGSNIAA